MISADKDSNFFLNLHKKELFFFVLFSTFRNFAVVKKNIGLFLLLCMLVGCVVDEPGEGSADTDLVGVGDRLPSFSVGVIDDTAHYTFSSDALTGPTVIVFFNTSCSDCQRELPVLNEYCPGGIGGEHPCLLAVKRPFYSLFPAERPPGVQSLCHRHHSPCLFLFNVWRDYLGRNRTL